jgi:hypothetical protein
MHGLQERRSKGFRHGPSRNQTHGRIVKVSEIELTYSTAGGISQAKLTLGTLIVCIIQVECDLVAHVAQNGRIRGYLYDPVAANFIPDDQAARLSDTSLRALAATPGQEVTYTAATPGAGPRLAFARHPSVRRRPFD